MLIKLNLIPILFALFVLPFEALSQMWAVTERGDTIYVYDDGSWSFTKDPKPEAKGNQELDYLSIKLEIDTIQNPFNYTGSTDKEVRSKFDFFSIYYDQELWKRVPPGELNAEAEIAFKSIEKDIYAMVITEEINVGQENIVKIAINTMKKKYGRKSRHYKSGTKEHKWYGFSAGCFPLGFARLDPDLRFLLSFQRTRYRSIHDLDRRQPMGKISGSDR